MVSFLTGHLFLLGEIYRNKKKEDILWRLKMKKYDTFFIWKSLGTLRPIFQRYNTGTFNVFCNAKSPNTYLTVYFYLTTWGWCFERESLRFFHTFK